MEKFNNTSAMSRGQKITTAILLALHFVILYLTLNRDLDFLFNDASHRIGPGTDFWAFYNAGLHWRIGDGIYLQGPGYGFRHHPIFAMTAMALVSHLKRTVAYFVWVVINEMLLLAILPVIRRMITNTGHFLVVLTLTVFFAPYYLEVYMGNATFMVAAIMIIAVFFFMQSRYSIFYPLYVAGLLIKPIGLLFLPVLLVKRHFKQVTVCLVIFAGLAGPYFLAYPEEWHKFVSVNFEGYPAAAGFLVHGGSQGLYALVLRIIAHLNNLGPADLHGLSQLSDFSAGLVRTIPYLFVGISLLTTYRLRNTNRFYLLFFIWSATYILGYKDVWEHSYSFLIFGLLCLYLANCLSRRLILAGSILIALPTAFALYDITIISGGFNDPDWFWNFPTSLVHHATRPIWPLLLYLVAVWSVWRIGPVKAEVEA